MPRSTGRVLRKASFQSKPPCGQSIGEASTVGGAAGGEGDFAAVGGVPDDEAAVGADAFGAAGAAAGAAGMATAASVAPAATPVSR
jgi:hypothetical protein